MRGSLTASDFDLFLDALDRDRDQAAGKYIALRERLEKFFEWRDCENVEELTDIVFDRAVRKLIEGEDVKNTEAFCVAIAKFIVLENRRETYRKSELDETLNASLPEDDNNSDEEEVKDKRFQCLDKCLSEFPVHKRDLLVKYFDTDEDTMIPARKRLAEKFGINL
ncbi:MAG: sigma-70 family RNA polymerase sigma factor, partial [Acidobacteria bacterium]|nr:sigma-70 family RNA polymerase sigma factor [Acidobacteriota bacterium]